MFKKEPKENTKPVGGLPFFISIFCLVIIAINNLIMFPSLIFTRFNEDGASITNLLAFISIAVFSGIAAKFLLKNEIAVLIHEFKHRLSANLVGNKYKKMNIEKDEGYIVYEYTKKTRMYNALIALAPYHFPIFTILILFFSSIFWWGNHEIIMSLTAIGYGADFYLGISDVGPHQSDFTGIQGGYYVALVYVIAINICIATFLLAWAFNGLSGIIYLIYGLAKIPMVIINALISKNNL
ncbi:MAG: M50 family metallopeptidase [Bdellovibrionota bacterium]